VKTNSVSYGITGWVALHPRDAEAQTPSYQEASLRKNVEIKLER
jgi:hypothetical protein